MPFFGAVYAAVTSGKAAVICGNVYPFFFQYLLGGLCL